MKIALLVFTMLLGNLFTLNALTLETVRKNYQLAIVDKSICRSMIQQLENTQTSHIHMAYLGAFQTIWARHTSNPISKLKTFNKGKTNIDKAVRMVPNSVEIIFIRYSVQRNSPGFLRYNGNLKEDRNFLHEKWHSITSETLKTMVEQLLNRK
ncbi:hypothetical protein [Olivibacter domesticus]|uniref:Uncharacterized protein n=1 Tax=Olivibacter domesticus TaxID=407022 RepID=A0A1H7KYZ2_OLID1|nr:hypothetical protein [Olivibacter domesticus]SEK91770.1 hypothetical protein SAMN05661044_01502 [Olivibacter domesticus]